MKYKFFLFCLILSSFLFNSCVNKKSQKWISQSPAGNAYTKINRKGKTVLPDGRFITPMGLQIKVAPHPYGLILSPNGQIAVTANSGVQPFSVSIIRNILSQHPQVDQIPKGYINDEGILASVYMGLAISPDNKYLYVAGGEEGKIFIFNLNNDKKIGIIDCNTKINGKKFTDSYIGDLTITRKGKLLYGVDQTNFRMIVINTKEKKLIGSVGVGRYPFGITLSPDEKHAYVANVGMFEYKLIKGINWKNLKKTAPNFPLFGYQTKEMKEGINTDTLQVPGLGNPNSPKSFSVWSIDIKNTANMKVDAKIKTGIKVGQLINGFPAVGGSSPNSVVATSKYVFVSNGNDDCISVINTKNKSVVKNINLTLDDRLKNLRGVIPFGLALSPNNKRLYIAESGINAVGVVDIPSLKVLGHIPVGWFPSKLKVSKDGKKLIVANAKGYGSGPNAGSNFKITPAGSYIGNIMYGDVSILNIPSDDQLPQYTRKVIKNNYHFIKASSKVFNWRKNNPIPLYPGEKKSPIKHIIFIAKENRTFDEIFGQLKDVKGDSAIARYGYNRSFSNGLGDQVDDVTVMVNHLKLAKKFAIADNFYCNSDVSADGHRWLADTYPNEWVEVNVPASYGGGRNMKIFSKAPGMLALTGASGAVYPEDYNEKGTLWDHLARGKIKFFNFGLGLDMSPEYEKMAYIHTGIRFVINYPLPEPLFKNTARNYPTFNTSIPDQFRIDMLIKDFKKRWLGKDKTLPPMITIWLPNDHGGDIRPKDGYPFTESYMMDNDLALGRLVDFLSHTPYWKSMAIFVTEDDPQGGVDHVDAHRSVLMVISPYTKHDYVSHVHYSFGSIMKTFWNILGLPYLNQYDAGATDLADFFTSKPDFTPYNVLPVDPEVFNPDKALTPFDKNFDWNAFYKSPKLDDPKTMEKWSREELKKHLHQADPPLAPLIRPEQRLFLDSLTVIMKNAYQKPKITYTLDGSKPTSSSKIYTHPIIITNSTTVKARAFWKTNLGSGTRSVKYIKARWINSVHPGKLEPGLKYNYYQGAWKKLPKFISLKYLRTGVIKEPDIRKIKHRKNSWGVLFKGYIKIPKDALYTFYLYSDDGSKLYINNKVVVDNDGSHSAREAQGSIALKSGVHPINLMYFQDYAGESFKISYKTKNIRKQVIPLSMYFHK